MTNTKFRKRALLSSVAMLLVALIALGSATFAWFAANPNATAKGISVKTTASTGLVIKSDTDTTWGHDVALANGKETFNLTPASQEQTATMANTFYTVDAETSSSYAAKSTNKVSTVSSVGYDGNVIYAEKVYFRFSDGHGETNKGTAQLNAVRIAPNTFTSGASTANATLAGAIRVSIANSAGDVIATYGITGSAVNASANTLKAPTGYASGTTTFAEMETQAFAGSTKFDCTAATYSAGTITGGQALSSAIDVATVALNSDTTGAGYDSFITVYVWLDGQDTNCDSDEAGANVNATEIIKGIQLDFNLK